ncbi:MAG TPA: aldo/keto reductase [Myxococcota bacterium]|nr:aldo/keto reductase [Myxococcota bacterium]
MKTRRLGKTGLVVSEICLGTMTFGSFADEKESHAMLDFADAKGVDFLDVAEIYPVPPDEKWAGRSEEIVGSWLEKRGRRETLFVATKIAGPSGGWFRAAVRGGRTALDRHNVERAVEGSLRRLRTDYIDLYQTHWPDPDLPCEEVMEALDRVVRAGKVRYVGCSNESAYGLTKSLWASHARGVTRYETIQNNFSLLNRRFEDELANVCRREKLSLLPYSPIAGGVLSGKYLGGAFPEGARFSRYRGNDPRQQVMTRRFVNPKTLGATERFAKIAADAGLPVVTLAVAWTLAHDFVGSTIIGATRVDQLEDSLRAADVTLSRDVLAACDAVSKEILYPMG